MGNRSIRDWLGGIITSPNIKKEPEDNYAVRYKHTPCKFFAMGYCIEEDKCDFLHEKPSNPSRNCVLVSDDGSESDTYDDYVPVSVNLEDFNPVLPAPENKRTVEFRDTDEIEELILRK